MSTRSFRWRRLCVTAVGALGLICVAAEATPGQQLSTNPIAGAAEVESAFHYANLAYHADDVVFARSSLQKAIDCLVGPDGKQFRAVIANPCAGQGMGAIRDIDRALPDWELQRAVEEASLGLRKLIFSLFERMRYLRLITCSLSAKR